MKGRVPQPSQIPASNDGASNTPERCTGLQTVAKTTVVKQSRSSETRHRIIAAARELFLAKGFDGTSVAEICRLAGVSNGALFHQFPTKEDLGFAVYTLVRRDFWGRVMAAMTEPDDPLDGVEAAVRAAFAFQRDDPGGAAFMFDVSGSKWIEDFADQSQVVHDIVSSRGLAWAEPHATCSGRCLCGAGFRGSAMDGADVPDRHECRTVRHHCRADADLRPARLYPAIAWC